jgi:hypothetical protein
MMRDDRQQECVFYMEAIMALKADQPLFCYKARATYKGETRGFEYLTPKVRAPVQYECARTDPVD